MSGSIDLTIGTQTVSASFGGTGASNLSDLRSIVKVRGYEERNADGTPRETPADSATDTDALIGQWFVDDLLRAAKRDRRKLNIQEDQDAQASRIDALSPPLE